MANSETVYCRVLKELKENSKEIKEIFLGDIEGNIIESSNSEYDLETIGNIISSTTNIIKDKMEEICQKGLKQIIIKGNQNFIILRLVNKTLVLFVLAETKIGLQSLTQSIQDTANKISVIFERR